MKSLLQHMGLAQRLGQQLTPADARALESGGPNATHGVLRDASGGVSSHSFGRFVFEASGSRNHGCERMTYTQLLERRRRSSHLLILSHHLPIGSCAICHPQWRVRFAEQPKRKHFPEEDMLCQRNTPDEGGDGTWCWLGVPSNNLPGP